MPTKYEYQRKLTNETLYTGVALVPLFLITHNMVKSLNISDVSKDTLSVFVAGCAFHLINENIGLNNWYVNNSATSCYVEQSQVKDIHELPVHMCDGKCGWYETNRKMFPHDIFHC